MTSIKQNLANLNTQIHTYEQECHHPTGSVTLLAVSKGQPLAKIQEAIAAGQTQFGENYLQEALLKIAALSAHKNLVWHFIGTVQNNKTKKIAENFQWVHSVTSIQQAKRLNEQRPTHLPPLQICIEINVSDEKSKSGAAFETIFELAAYCLTLPNIKLRGLMTIPEPKNNMAEQRAEFKKLTDLFENLREKGFMLDTLSMGMTSDWKAAIAEGSNLIRIGTGIFGARN